MSLAQLKEEIQRLSADERAEVEKLLRILRVINAPGYRERITKANAEIDSGRGVSQEQFEAAQRQVKTLSATPATRDLLELYALYKQGTEGDAQGKRPGMLDVKGRAKFDAWTGKKGLTREKAMESYVSLVKRLAGG